MDAASLFGAIGGTGGLAALAYVIKLMFDARRESSRSVNEDRRAPLLDTAAANTVLRETLDAVQDDNERLGRRIVSLETALKSRDNEIDHLIERLRKAETELSNLAADMRRLREGTERA